LETVSKPEKLFSNKIVREEMGQLIVPDYTEQFLFPPALEDWVAKDHPARFIREFVEALDLAGLGFKEEAAREGRPRYAPSLLLKIWLYGYVQRIRSTRKLEVACREHLSLLWLTGTIQPDHNSLWRFWRDHKAQLRSVFKQTVRVAVRSGCVGLVLQAVDGTKIASCASSRTGWSKEQMEKLLAVLEESLEETDLKVAEENQSERTEGYRLPAGLAQREALRDQIKEGLAQLAQEQRQHYHPKEPEARRMETSDTNRYAYNAQAVADQAKGIIVACDVTRQETDVGQLAPMIAQARANEASGHQTVTAADQGYGAGADLLAAQQQGMNVLAPPAEGKSPKGNPYATQHFHYDAEQKSVTCPRGEQLHHEGHTIKQGLRIERYRCQCPDCPVKAQCTQDPKGRQIEVRPHTALVQQMRKLLAQPVESEQWAQRGSIIERPFAQVKQHDGFRRWTVRGLESVRTQWALVCAAVNLRILYKHWLERPKHPAALAFAVRAA
jgi:transposase